MAKGLADAEAGRTAMTEEPPKGASDPLSEDDRSPRRRRWWGKVQAEDQSAPEDWYESDTAFADAGLADYLEVASEHFDSLAAGSGDRQAED
jgi:hypothetical protein